MTIDQFKDLKKSEGNRVCMLFTDGEQVVATLVDVSTDLDGSRQLIYDRFESSRSTNGKNSDAAYYSSGDDLVSCISIPTRS